MLASDHEEQGSARELILTILQNVQTQSATIFLIQIGPQSLAHLKKIPKLITRIKVHNHILKQTQRFHYRCKTLQKVPLTNNWSHFSDRLARYAAHLKQMGVDYYASPIVEWE